MSIIKEGLEEVGEFFEDNWQEIVMVAAVTFTAGVATVGTEGFSGAMEAYGGGLKGALAATGSTMWAGATSVAGSFGLGEGASGTAAAYGVASGHGRTLGTGAAADWLGLGDAGVSPEAADAAQKALDAGEGWQSALGQAGQMTTAGKSSERPAEQSSQEAEGGLMSEGGGQQAGQQGQGGNMGGGLTINYPEGPDLMQTVTQAAIPSLVQAGGAYLAASGQQEAQEPNALYGYDFDSGQAYSPQAPNPNTPQAPGLMNQPPGPQSAPAPQVRGPNPPSVNYPIWQQRGGRNG